MYDYTVTFKNKNFFKEKVELDGKKFENCQFHDCMVIVKTGQTRLTNCVVNNCKLILQDNAYTIGQIINLFTKGRPLKVAEYDETGSFFPKAKNR